MMNEMNEQVFFRIPQELYSEISQYLSPRDYYYFISGSKKWESIKYQTIVATVESSFLEPSRKGNAVSFTRRLSSTQYQLQVRHKSTYSPSQELQDLLVSLKLQTFHFDNMKDSEIQIKEWQSQIDAEHLIITENIGSEHVTNIIGHPERISLRLFHPKTDHIILPTISNLYEVAIDSYSHVENVNCLQNVYKLTLVGLDLDDVSQLGNVHDINLKRCHQLRDISALVNNYKITIYECTNINIDTANFKNVVELDSDLFDSSRLKPVSFSLQAARKLKVNLLNKVEFFTETISKLENLVSLSINTNFPIPLKMNNFLPGNLHELSLHFCTITDLVCFGNIACISLSHCDITSKNHYGKQSHNRIVHLCDCCGVDDYSYFNFILKLSICNDSAFIHPEQVKNVKYLSLTMCDNLIDITALGTVEHLVIVDCNGIKSFKGLGKVRTLEYQVSLSEFGIQTYEDFSSIVTEKFIFTGYNMTKPVIHPCFPSSRYILVLDSTKLPTQSPIPEMNKFIYLRLRDNEVIPSSTFSYFPIQLFFHIGMVFISILICYFYFQFL
jgi:hypothetical protein